MPEIDTTAHEVTGEVVSCRALKGNFRAVSLRQFVEPLVGELDPGEATEISGMLVTFYGTWKQHARHGWQFAFEGHQVLTEQSPTGMVNYLSRCGAGLSRSAANKLVKAYGTEAIKKLRDCPGDVAAAGYLPLEAAEKASDILTELARFEKPRLELFSLFAGHGLSKKVVRGCLSRWQHKAPQIVRHDPFRMLVERMDGVGFKKADSLYQALGLPLDRLKRQVLAGWWSLLTDGDGNTWENRQKINAAILDAIGIEHFKGPEAIELGLRGKWFCKLERDGEEWLAVIQRASDEETVAENVCRLMMAGGTPWPTIAKGELSDHQFEKVQTIIGAHVGILAGTPGTGKTFTAAALLKEIIKRIPVGRVAVCAPTGKAAVRITAAMQRYELPLQATTIHKLLLGGPDGGFKFDEVEQLPQYVIVVDETSMVDCNLMAALLRAVRSGSLVLFVGDPFQLAPVGHGAPLRDMIAANVPCGLLSEIQRNAGLIVKACADIKDGRRFADTQGAFGPEPDKNLKLVSAKEPETQAAVLVTVFEQIVAKRQLNPIWDVQVIVARNDDTEVSRKKLNPKIQELLNPQDQAAPEGMRNEKYRVGDKMICLKNMSLPVVKRRDQSLVAALGPPAGVEDWSPAEAPDEPQAYVANGDQGRVIAVSPGKIIVEFVQPTRVCLIDEKPHDNTDFDLAYAITCHKAQGSEWPMAIVMADSNAYGVTSREWIYTAISRAAKMCLIIGDKPIITKMVGRVQLNKRKTFLREKIEERRRWFALKATDVVEVIDDGGGLVGRGESEPRLNAEASGSNPVVSIPAEPARHPQWELSAEHL